MFVKVILIFKLLKYTKAIKKVIEIIEENKLDMLEFNISESKISIDFKSASDPF